MTGHAAHTPENRALAHARLLLSQGRADLAIGPLREAFGQDPDNPEPAALLAWCLLQDDEYTEATELASRAVQLDPTNPFHHYVLGTVFLDRNMRDEAMTQAREALRLDPADPDHYALLAAIHAEAKRWRDGLESARQGLALDAEHQGCRHVEVVALRGLGRHDRAADAGEGSLRDNPDSAYAHANTGWTCLHRGDVKNAKTHFREALRLDPDLEMARTGIVEAIKASNPVYRLFLRYMLWMSTKGNAVQWGVMLGGYFGYQLVKQISAQNPGIAPYLLPLIVGYFAFVLLTWFAMPVFNLLLLAHPLGRHALDPDSRRWAVLFGAILTLSLGLVVAYVVDPAFETPAWTVPFLIVPVAGAGQAREGKPRAVMVGVLSVLAVACAGVNAYSLATGGGVPPYYVLYPLACVLSMLLVSFVNSSAPPVKR